MSGDYYRELEHAHTACHRDGWRYGLEQQFRFEAVLDVATTEDRTLLDLGCGSGDFGRWIADDRDPPLGYVGVDRRPPRGAESDGGPTRPPSSIVIADFFLDALAPADLVVAIGALVDGRRRTDLDRYRRLNQLLERCVTLARRGVAVWILRQERLDAKPVRDPALCGASEAELEAFAAGLRRRNRSCEVTIRADLLQSEYLLLYRDGGLPAVRGCDQLIDAVCSKLAPAAPSPLERVRLLLDCGRLEAAERSLQTIGGSSGEAELLRDRARLQRARSGILRDG
ncbi:MAG: hypothetical protein KC609_00825 [Myxococcales bacterium]|nr:hypothetical protein [Myxococcales bacterium]